MYVLFSLVILRNMIGHAQLNYKNMVEILPRVPKNHLKFFQIGNTLERLSHKTKENKSKHYLTLETTPRVKIYTKKLYNFAIWLWARFFFECICRQKIEKGGKLNVESQKQQQHEQFARTSTTKFVYSLKQLHTPDVFPYIDEDSLSFNSDKVHTHSRASSTLVVKRLTDWVRKKKWI